MDRRLLKIKKLKNQPYSQNYQEHLYEYLRSFYFLDEAFRTVCNETGFSLPDVKKQLLDYGTKVLNYTKDEFYIFIDSQKNNANTILKIDNPALLEIGLKSKFLWTNETEKEIVLEYIYNNCEKNHFTDQSIIDLSNKFEITFKQVKDLLKEYMKFYKKMTKDEIETRLYSVLAKGEYDYKKFKSRLYPVYKALASTESFDYVEEIIKSSNLKFSYIRSTFRSYEHLFSKEDANKISKFINEYNDFQREKSLESYRRKRKEAVKRKCIEKEEKLLNDIEDLINSFILSNETLENYCFKNGITKTRFNKYFDYLKENNKLLYDKCIKHIASINKSKIEEKESVKKIVDMLENGVNENGIRREMDLVDFFSNTNNSIERLRYLGLMVIKDKELMKKYRKYIDEIEKNKKDIPSKSEINEILNQTTYINIKFDKFNNIISKTEVKREVKEKILEFLIINDVPLNKWTYQDAFKRYKKGYLIFNKKTKKLVPKKNS